MAKASKTLLLFLALFLAGCQLAGGRASGENQAIEYKEPTQFFLYLPTSYDPTQSWPAFVGVHGSNGDGSDCLDMWQASAEAVGFVLICPSLADENGGWSADNGDRKLAAIMRRMRQEYRLLPKVFLAGFSAGAEFAQFYSFKHPNAVAGAALLSSGNYHTPPDAARSVPFMVVIGDGDNPYAVDGARQFSQFLKEHDFSVELKVLPGVQHVFTDTHRDLSIQFYRRVMKP